MRTVCPSCATEVPEGSRFCLSCGARLAAPSAAAEERKVVTTLFCDLVGFTAMSEAADPEDVDAILRGYHAAARNVIESHGGTVEKFIGDAVVGVFGVPAAHEDDPERAVRAGLRIVQALEGMTRPDGGPLEVRVGVNTGEALVRLDVDPLSGRGFLTGDAVNVAARLQAAAPPGGVVAGAPTHDLTTRRITYEELAPVAAKGKSASVAAWLATAPIACTGMEARDAELSPHVGRAHELALLEELLETAALSRTTGFALVVGEPGIGKTRLVRELFASVDARPQMITWRQGRCPPYGDGVAVWPLAEIVRSHAGILGTDDHATIAAKLGSTVPEGPDADWLLLRLGALFGLDAPQATREENFAAWLRFIEEVAAAHTAVIVFEDLHWADEVLLGFLAHAAENLRDAPLLIVATARPELLEQHPEFAGADTRIRRVALHALAEGDMRGLVVELIGRETAGLSDVDAVVARVGGNPFYAEESVRLLVDQAVALREGAGPAGVGTNAGAPAAVPGSVQAVLAARLDSLPPREKAMLADAAVVGERFWPGALAAVGDCDVAEVDRALNDLAARSMIRRQRNSSMGGEPEYAFRHALVRDVAYAQVPRGARAAKHAAVAGWMEAGVDEHVRDLAGIIAYHYVTALDLSRAAGRTQLADSLVASTVDWLTSAGDRAMDLGVAAARGEYARAVELAPPPDARRAPLLRKLGEALIGLGAYGAAAAATREAVDLFLAAGRDTEAAVALSRLEVVLYRTGAPGRREVMDQSVALVEGRTASPQVAEVLAERAGAAYGDYETAEAVRWADKARAVYEEIGERPPLRLLGIRAAAACFMGEQGAFAQLLHAMESGKDRAPVSDVATLYMSAGAAVGFAAGAPAEVLWTHQGVMFARSRGMQELENLLRVNLIDAQLTAGDWANAEMETAVLAEAFQGSESVLPEFNLMINGATLLVRTGRVDEANELLERARRRGEALLVRADVGAGYMRLLAEVLAARGDDDGACGALNAWWRFREAGRLGDEMDLPVVRSALAVGERTLARAVADAPPSNGPASHHAVISMRALLAEARGEYEEAAAGFADAAAGWHEFGVPYEEGHAHLGHGRCLVALGRAPEATAPLAAAREIFARLGAKPALAETEAVPAAACTSSEAGS